jgi:hypothetical protein
MMDESLLKPNAPQTGPYAYENNPHGQDDLHITLLRFTNSRSSWLKTVSFSTPVHIRLS